MIHQNIIKTNKKHNKISKTFTSLIHHLYETLVIEHISRDIRHKCRIFRTSHTPFNTFIFSVHSLKLLFTTKSNICQFRLISAATYFFYYFSKKESKECEINKKCAKRVQSCNCVKKDKCLKTKNIKEYTKFIDLIIKKKWIVSPHYYIYKVYI